MLLVPGRSRQTALRSHGYHESVIGPSCDCISSAYDMKEKRVIEIDCTWNSVCNQDCPIGS